MSDPRWLDGARDPGRRALRTALDEEPRFRPSDFRRRRVWARIEGREAGWRAKRKAFVAGALAASALLIVGAVAVQRLLPWRAGRDPALLRASPAVEMAVVSRPARPTSERARAAASTLDRTALPDVASYAAVGSIVVTGPGESATRRLAAGVRAELRPNTALHVEGEAEAEVQRGEVRFDAPFGPPGEGSRRPFIVRVAAYHMVIAGARFSVRVAGAGSVHVDAGAAEVWNRGRVTRLGPGESWTAPRRPLRALALTSLGRFPPAKTDVARTRDDVADLSAAREASERDPTRAIALYEQVAARGTAAAQNALYEIGSLYRDKLHNPARALEAWERYRVRYPHGVLRIETDLSILDTLAAMRRRHSALEEALGFLKRYPASERRGEVARVAGDLARGLGQCGVAADLYAAAARAQISGDDADDAAFGRAACLVTGSDPRATSALDAYLTEHPQGRHLAEARRLSETGGHPR